MIYQELLSSELRNFQIGLSSRQEVALARYCEEIVRWNEKMNLTGLHGPQLVRRLIAEPVWIGQQLKLHGSLLDIGSGNGSPGIPIHIACGCQETHLVEVRTKRAAFLRHVISVLKTHNIIVHKARFEDIESSAVDWITLQGVALNPQLMQAIKRFASVTTNIVWITSSDVEAPYHPAKKLIVPLTGTQVLLLRRDLF